MTDGFDQPPATAPQGWKPSRGWWLRQFLLTATAAFFVYFGISLLIASYRLGDPFSFIMTFFAANLIILISVVMVIGFVLRMHLVRRAASPARQTEDDL